MLGSISVFIEIFLSIFCRMVFILHKMDIYGQSYGHLRFSPLVDSCDIGTLFRVLHGSCSTSAARYLLCAIFLQCSGLIDLPAELLALGRVVSWSFLNYFWVTSIIF